MAIFLAFHPIVGFVFSHGSDGGSATGTDIMGEDRIGGDDGGRE